MENSHLTSTNPPSAPQATTSSLLPERGVVVGPILSASDIALWNDLISAAGNIVITCHRGPDGDALGSTLALCSWLRRHKPGSTVHVVAPNIFPDFLRWMPGATDILIYDKHEADVRPVVDAADLIIMCDHGELSRMWTLGDAVRSHECPRIMLDHHLDPEQGIAALTISHPELSSTCEVLLRVLLQLGSGLTHDEAVCIYTGMMTDTGAFTYASTRPEIYQLISLLLACGIDKDKIYRNVFFTYSPARMRFMGYMLYAKLDIMKKSHVAILTLTNAERRRLGILNGDTEGIVNMPLQIMGIKLSVFLREDTEQPCIRVSLRSVDDFPCNTMAADYFSGGGHKNAAGGEIWGTMDEAVALVRKAVQKYLPLLKGQE